PMEFVKTEPYEAGLKVLFNAPNDFLGHWVRERYKSHIEEAFSQVTGSQCTLVITVSEETKQAAPVYEPPVESSKQSTSSKTSNTHLPIITGGNNSRYSPEVALDPRYTFESFVVGASNQFA